MSLMRNPSGGASAYDVSVARMETPQRARSRGNLALNLPIAWRLTLGFVVAGLIAAAAAGIVGFQRAQALSQQSAFYQTLLQNSTNLATGDTFLQLMDSKTHEILDVASSPDPSTETLTSDEQDVPRLAQYYDSLITSYAAHDLLSQSADQLATLRLADDTTSVTKQTALVSSAVRAWQAYRDAQLQVLASVTAGDIVGAQTSERLAAEPSNADAQSALRALIQFNNSLSGAVRRAATAQESNLQVTSIIAALLAFAAVALVGWFISETIVRRLRSLRAVTQAVEQGRLNSRVRVTGRDEIGDVSASVNGMLDTIVGLLEETRRQRDALSNAAERLFTDMRVASGGDLRVSASVSSDPIGLLGNAFNLTIGRFKRFISRSRLATDQLDGMARQQVERADAFIVAVRRTTSVPGSVSILPSPETPSWPMGSWSGASAGASAGAVGDASERPRAPLTEHIERVDAPTRRISGDEVVGRARRTLEHAEQAYLSLMRLGDLMARLPRTLVEVSGVGDELTEEMRTLDTILQGMGREAFTLNQDLPQAAGELREACARVRAAASAGAPVSAAQPSFAQGALAADGQVFEFVRLASEFAQEMSALARQLLVVAQEMRVNVTPFQVDSAPDMANGWGQASAYQPNPPLMPY